MELSEAELAVLIATFLAQVAESLEEIDRQAMALEAEEDPAGPLAEIRRAVHTIKGDAGAVGYPRVAALAHRLEDAVDAACGGHGQVAPAPLTALLLDWTGLVRSLLEGSGPPAGAVEAALEEAIARLWLALTSGPPPAPAPASWRAALTFDARCRLRAAGAVLVVRRLAGLARVVAAEPGLDDPALEASPTLVLHLDGVADPSALRRACLVGGIVADVALESIAVAGGATAVPAAARAGDDLPTRSAGETAPHAAQGAAAPVSTVAGVPAAPAAAAEPLVSGRGDEAARGADPPRRVDMVRVDAARLDHAMALVGELALARAEVTVAVSALATRYRREAEVQQLGAAMSRLDRSLRELQKTVLGTRLVPVDLLFRRLPRVVREVALARGREVRLVTEGGDTELDKGLVDALAEPLLHVVRNAVDHGLEPPEARVAAGKPREGRLSVAARHVGNQVVVEIEDDGRGIDRAAVGRRALEQGLVSAEALAQMGEAEQLGLIFAPGLSTADAVTEVSGRGIGMDVVRQTVERLRGRAQVESTPGVGTRITLRLPLTLAIQKALLVRVGCERYALPLTAVLELSRPPAAAFERVEGLEVLRLRDAIVPLLRLREVVSGSANGSGSAQPETRPAIAIVTDGERRFGLVVEGLAGEEELVIKALDNRWAATPLASGAAVLGDGRAVLILDVAALAGRLARSAGGAR
jgi:two-component system chemotaxis sensor kinase CheA